MTSQFFYKGQGRIFVHTEKDIARVKKIGERLDPFEWVYMPEDFIAVYPGKTLATLVYSGKFEPDLEKLREACMEEGIPILCLARHQDDGVY